MMRAAPSTSARATLLRAEVRILCTVPREIPMLAPACSWVNPCKSQSRKVPKECLYCTGKKRGDKHLPATVLAEEKNRTKEEDGDALFFGETGPATPLG